MSKVLIVIDMQNDFIDGSLGTKEAQAIIPNVEKKIEEYECKLGEDVEIFFTKDTHDENYLQTQEGKLLPIKHCIIGTDGWNIHDTFIARKIVIKDAFGYTPWRQILPIGITGIEIVGVVTDICVISNALILKAQLPEIPITVDASCCAGTTPERHKAALEVMKSCQINVISEGE